MPNQVVFIIIFGIFIIISVSIIIFINIKNLKQQLSYSIDGHLIEIKTGFNIAQLFIDKKVVDEIQSYQMNTIKLQAKFDEKQIIINIGVGFLKPKIITFIDNIKINELSNT